MARRWIDDGLRRETDRETEQRSQSERRLHHAALIREQGPVVMRALIADIHAALAEYAERSRPRNEPITLQALPHEGFCVERTGLPGLRLECRPDYTTPAVYCNLTRTEGHGADTRELVFTLHFTVDEDEAVALSYGDQSFATAAAAVEFLVKPVLFPTIDPRH